MLSNLEYLNVPTKVVILLIIILVISQVVGAIADIKGKMMPGFLQLARVVKEHKKRNKVIDELPNTIRSLSESVESLAQVVGKIDIATKSNATDILNMRISNMRAEYMDFASSVATNKRQYTKEQWHREQRLYEEYELLIAANNMTNGEMEISHEIVEEKYKEAILHNNFLGMQYEK